jgi:RimJ/RimL family protein N-acetyltransferase
VKIEVTSPFPFEALPRVWRWIETFREKVSDDFSPRDLKSFLESMARRWDRQKTWAVRAGDELGGLVIFERRTEWLGTARYVFKPDFQGKGLAVKACRAAVAQMLAEPGIGKLEFHALAGNLAIGSLVCSLGAKREGTLEGHTLCGGKPTDVWLYGLRKEAFEETTHGISV